MRACVCLFATVCIGLGIVAAGDRMTYSSTKKNNHLDQLHGIEVSDPYRWLEEDVRESKDVAEWVVAKNQETSAYLESIPQRVAIKERLRKIRRALEGGKPILL